MSRTRLTFGRAIASARQARGMSQQAAADAVGVSVNTLQRAEAGTNDCHRLTAVALVQFFDLPPETMLLA